MACSDQGIVTILGHQLESPTQPLDFVSASADPADGAAVRRRGRPRGSRNRPKDPIIIIQERADTLHAIVIEVGCGGDVLGSIADYASRHKCGVYVVGCSGIVAEVRLWHRSTMGNGNGVVTLPGFYQIVSLSGSFLPPPAPPGATSFSIYVDIGQGQVVGGKVLGPLIASGTVYVMASTFAKFAHERVVEPPQLQMRPPAMQGSGESGSGADVGNSIADISF